MTMIVKLIGPDPDHVSEHKLDAATAVVLVNQLRSREELPDGTFTALRMTLDEEVVLVTEARCQFWTEGDTLSGQLSMRLMKAGPQ